MLASERWSQITEAVCDDGSVTVKDLAFKLGVSVATVRRDLKKMDEKGLLLRIHGGAVPTRRTEHNIATGQPEEVGEAISSSLDWRPLPSVNLLPRRPLTNELRRIATCAMEFIEPGDTILLDGGSTAHALAEAICDHPLPLTVITISLSIAFRLFGLPQVTAVIAGGELTFPDAGLRGIVAEETISRLRATKLFLGALGISSGTGLVYSSLELAQLKRAMVQSAEKVIVICAASKLKGSAGASIIPIDRAHVLITGQDAPAEEVNLIQSKGVDVRLV